MNSRIRTAATAATLPLVLSSFAAAAGTTEAFRVQMLTFNDGSGTAVGDLRTARRSSNALERIGCTMVTTETKVGDPTSVRHAGTCQARDAAGQTATCFTRNPRLLDSMQAATSYGFVRFDWRVDGSCKSITYTHSSTLLP